MIKLIQFSQTGKPDPSPFCGKVELYLKVNKLEHEVSVGSPVKAPKKKLPMIVDGDDTVCDSEHIVQFLDKKYGIDMDVALSAEQKAQSWALIKAIDEHLYFTMVYSRWIDDRNWPTVKSLFFGKIPFPLSTFLPGMIRSSVHKSLKGQGIGRHSQQEIYAFAAEGVAHLAQFLGDKDYFFGDKISKADMSAFSLLYNQINFAVETEIGVAVNSHQNLVDYVARISNQYYA